MTKRALSMQIPFDLPVAEDYGDAHFLVDDSNREAFDWIKLWPQWPAPALIVYGPASSGKTHLAHIWARHADARILAVSSILESDLQHLSDVPACVLIDRADFAIGDARAERNLFHLYNIAREGGTSILMTMRQPPHHLSFVVPDLASRLRAAPAVSIREPDEVLLKAVLSKLFRDRQIDVADDVLNYAVMRMERSFDAAKKIVAEADRLSLAEKKKVSAETIRRVLMPV